MAFRITNNRSTALRLAASPSFRGGGDCHCIDGGQSVELTPADLAALGPRNLEGLARKWVNGHATVEWEPEE